MSPRSSRYRLPATVEGDSPEEFLSSGGWKERMRQNFHWGFLAGIFLLALLNGCAAFGLTLFGVGAGVGTGTAVAYTLDGTAYRTFTAPLPKAEEATLTALNRMGITVEKREKTE